VLYRTVYRTLKTCTGSMLSRLIINRRGKSSESDDNSGMPVRSRSQKPAMVATIDEESPLDDLCGNPKGAVKKSESFNDGVKKPALTTSAKAKNIKRLHWNHKVEKKRHHRLCDLKEAEKECVWYTENDTKIILGMAKVTVKMMMKGEPCDDVDYCSRGLEGKTPTGSKRRQKNKQRVRKALLEEQTIQREEGVYDPEYLAQVSIKYSKTVIEEAYQSGLRDERAIEEYLNITRGDYSPIQPRRIQRS
jgi:hypothetical protein